MPKATSENPEIVRRAAAWPDREALAAGGDRYTYGALLHASDGLSRRLSGDRVVFLLPPGFDHVAWQWAIWRAGAVAVPLSSSQAPAEWDYIVGDIAPALVVADDESEALADIAERHGAEYLPWNPASAGFDGSSAWDPASAAVSSPLATPQSSLAGEAPALILYTSGTTSRPKGVVLTHANLEAQTATLVKAWGWRADDRILHVLPLNHVHGIVNVLGCALWAGACCEFLSPFDAEHAWDRLASGEITVFMAVPTIYTRLLAAFDAADEASRQRWAGGRARCG